MPQTHPHTFSVKDHGAAGDGSTVDTAALQRAVDACHTAGGGRVLVPPGRYITGTLWLKSHVELHLCPGAELFGSTERADYNPDDAYPENGIFTTENVTGAHLIIAHRAENVSITGTGTINGNGPGFFDELPPEEVTTSYRYKSKNFPIRDWRPAQMVVFCCCTGVRVTDVNLIDSPYWTLFCHGSDDVAIRGVTVRNAPQTANGDGIDIDVCRNVTISDCRIASGDDSITIRANNRLIPDRPVCENVTVTGCVLSSPCCAVRVGVGDAAIRNVTFSNLVIVDSRSAIMFVSRYSERSPRGACIEDVHFSNLRIDAVHAFNVRIGHPATAPAGIRRVSFSHIDAHCDSGSLIAGTAATAIEGIRLVDVTLRLHHGTDNREYCGAVPELDGGAVAVHYRGGYDGTPAIPAGLAMMHCREVALSGLTLRWQEPLGAVWDDGLFFRDIRGLHLQGCTLAKPRAEGGAVVRCEDVHDMTVQGCLVQGPAEPFVACDEASDRPVAIGNLPRQVEASN